MKEPKERNMQYPWAVRYLAKQRGYRGIAPEVWNVVAITDHAIWGVNEDGYIRKLNGTLNDGSMRTPVVRVFGTEAEAETVAQEVAISLVA
jgi:hypothetical protein